MDLFHAVIGKYLPPPSRIKDLLDLCVNEAKYFVDKIDELSIKVKQNERNPTKLHTPR